MSNYTKVAVDREEWNEAVITWTLWMSVSSDFILRWGQRSTPYSLHFLFNTVSPTFNFLEASAIGRLKYFSRSRKAMLATCSVAARFFFIDTLVSVIINSYYQEADGIEWTAQNCISLTWCWWQKWYKKNSKFLSI